MVEVRLRSLGPGSFLIRESISTPGSFTLGVNAANQVSHIKIARNVSCCYDRWAYLDVAFRASRTVLARQKHSRVCKRLSTSIATTLFRFTLHRWIRHLIFRLAINVSLLDHMCALRSATIAATSLHALYLTISHATAFVLCRAVVTNPYKPLNSTELELVVGQTILVTEKDVLGWFSRGLVEGTSHIGLFPSTCVDYLKSAAF